ncbi:type II toxin-antitoxin system Phd/YefM family antitoxin [Agrobacterium vitis]|uniref:type II toxin-antitoxin system prevent-host-death family antitoxin n=1 Tax=Allorhizobium ampelinum TaxID=3025782 RepID=UPI001F32977F|nr:type II toxin-antitoxin system prevent-host-death family antitoxin [Allorhizobium ampelinum]MCF1461226.1 type II toxin-antitoxin system Phd/YefM family antitoxin [Allorhizobium ampelinum]
MTMTHLTSRELKQDVSRAKRAVEAGPLVITDSSWPSLVLMTYDEFERLTGKRRNLIDTLSLPGLSSISYETPRVELRPVMSIFLDSTG